MSDGEVLVFGSDSLVGSHFVEALGPGAIAAGRRDPRPLGLSVGSFVACDVTQATEVDEAVRSAGNGAIVNFAAATDVDGVERERPSDPSAPPRGWAYELNALAPERIARAAHASGRYFVSISTDFVFDGTAGPYAESTEPDAFSPRVSWYGWTKGEGERRLRSADPDAGVVRIAYPYRSHFDRKVDFARSLLARARQGTLPPLFTDQRLTPTWIPDVTRALAHLVERRRPGVFHVASPEVTTPFEFGSELLRTTGTVPPGGIPRGSIDEFLRRPNATPRPRCGGLRCARLPDAGVSLTGWREGIRLMAAEGIRA